jgi:hypothetical protein
VFENRVLCRVFGPERDEMIGDLIKQIDEELHNLSSSPNIIKMIKSTNMRWAGHVARNNACRNFVGKPKGKNHWEDLDLCESVILRKILKK